MAFGYEYWMIYLPDFNRNSFLLFVRNPAGSTKLRDYSCGENKTVGNPEWKFVCVNTIVGKTRFSVEPHLTTDARYWSNRTIEFNSKFLQSIQNEDPSATIAMGQVPKRRSGNSVTRGPAQRGSRRQLQEYVNKHQQALSNSILEALPSLVSGLKANIEWVSPLAEDNYVEFRDRDFLEAVGLEDSGVGLDTFWPTGGPSWDALGIVSAPNGRLSAGVIMVEAKSHIAEIYGAGCQAAGSSRVLIEASLAAAKHWCGACSDADWTGNLYQSANRLAHLYFIRERLRCPAWLINLYFLDDPIGPTNRDQWNVEVQKVKISLGLNASVLSAVEVFLPALSIES